ncbi:BnaA02g35500D [Brassica napus]|uniref:BnaA02g35500D protein n=1 Tax=Brassica napus TaxID=3708 RepID=A0A078JHS0_BRANA|nr:BnaA02g35500D [Brassica napus]
MEISKTLLLVVSLVAATCFLQARAAGVYCSNPYSKCYRKYIECPEECPSTTAMNSKYKVCYADCDKRPCTSQCRMRKPNCNRPGSACYDPRFIGGDGIVFYFHGKSNEEFSLINAAKTATWDNEVDHLKFTFDGQDLSVPEETLATWYSPNKDIKIERVTMRNSAIVTIKDKAEIMVNVVPVTKEDDRIHSYKVPSDDCFAHLEAQFKFFNLSPKVDGILGRTYKPDFQNPAKPGVAMPVVGGEDSFKTSSLLSNDCKTCIFSESHTEIESVKSEIEYAALDCTRGASSGYGIVCRK